MLKYCDSTAVCVERVLLKTSVYMGNGWFSSSLRETNTFHFYRECVPVKSSVCMGSGWLSCAVMPIYADAACLEQVLRKSSI